MFCDTDFTYCKLQYLKQVDNMERSYIRFKY